MQKILLTSLLTLLLSSFVYADMFRIEGAVGMWNAESSGTMGYKNNSRFDVQTSSGFDTETIAYAWILFKQPLPLIPNVRLEYTDLAFNGLSKNGFTWENEVIGVGATTDLDLKQYDAIIYYNILDNTLWATLDVGIDAKFIQSTLKISDPSDGYAYSKSDDFMLPMLYARMRAQIPATGFGLEADMKWIGYGSTANSYDVRIKADYTFDMFVLEPTVEIGYRTLMLDIDGDEVDINANADIDFSGLFFGVGLRF